MLLAFDVRLHLVNVALKSVSTTLPAFVFHMRLNIIDWNHWGEWVCVYRQIGLVDWPPVQLGLVSGAENINTFGKMHTNLSVGRSKADGFTFTYSIHQQVDSLVSWQGMSVWEMSLQLYCIHTIKGNYSPAQRVNQQQHIKEANIVCLEKNWSKFHQNAFQNAFLLVNQTQHPITKSLHHH